MMKNKHILGTLVLISAPLFLVFTLNKQNRSSFGQHGCESPAYSSHLVQWEMFALSLNVSTEPEMYRQIEFSLDPFQATGGINYSAVVQASQFLIEVALFTINGSGVFPRFIRVVPETTDMDCCQC